MKHQDKEGATALILASKNGHVKCVQRLVKAGAPLDVATAQGGSALHFACRDGSAACVKTLLGAKGTGGGCVRARPPSTRGRGAPE